MTGQPGHDRRKLTRLLHPIALQPCEERMMVSPDRFGRTIAVKSSAPQIDRGASLGKRHPLLHVARANQNDLAGCGITVKG
jgi:hypothetical protein